MISCDDFFYVNRNDYTWNCSEVAFFDVLAYLACSNEVWILRFFTFLVLWEGGTWEMYRNVHFQKLDQVETGDWSLLNVQLFVKKYIVIILLAFHLLSRAV